MELAFEDLLALDVESHAVVSAHGALLVLGDDAASVAAHMAQARGLQAVGLTHHRILFGLPMLTAPFPVFVNQLITERNTQMQKLALFGWIEDNGLMEPRAEVLGLTPLGAQPVVFLRDCDLDRPVEAWLHPGRGRWHSTWLRVAGIVVVDENVVGDRQTLSGDWGALAVLGHILPSAVQPFVLGLHSACAQGQTLRAALRTHRQTTADALMHVCDGWRVLAHAIKVVRVHPQAAAHVDPDDAALLESPRRW